MELDELRSALVSSVVKCPENKINPLYDVNNLVSWGARRRDIVHIKELLNME